MELANCRLHVGNEDTVPLKGVTPAEALILVSMHKTRAKKHPLEDLKVIGTAQSVKVAAVVQEQDATYEVDTKTADGTVIPAGKNVRAGTVLKDAIYESRTSAGELSRLKTKYHKQYITPLFPSPATPLPETFEEAAKMWVEQAPVEQGEVGNWTDVPGPIKTVKQPSPIIKA